MPEKGPYVLQTDCILRVPMNPDPAFGVRVAVMSRLTLNDGVTHDKRLDGRWDQHHPELGPPPKLIGDYYRSPDPSWDDFALSYLDHLSGHVQRQAMEEVLFLLHTANVTMMCIQETPDKCHRRLLAEEMWKIMDGLRVDVR